MAMSMHTNITSQNTMMSMNRNQELLAMWVIFMLSMNDLAVQGANGATADSEKAALQSEYNELGNIISNTSFGGQKLFGKTGAFAREVSMQIGGGADQVLTVDVSAMLGTLHTGMEKLSTYYFKAMGGTLAANATPTTNPTKTDAQRLGGQYFWCWENAWYRSQSDVANKAAIVVRTVVVKFFRTPE